MTAKTYLAACALTATAAIVTAAPAVADNHYPGGGQNIGVTEQPETVTVPAPAVDSGTWWVGAGAPR